MFFYLLLAFTLVPILEIWLLIRIGSVIHAGPTVALVLLTGLVGAALARHEGLQALNRIQRTLAQGGIPANEMLSGLLILIAGALLVTPGVITDLVGFALLVPPLRGLIGRGLASYFKRRLVVTGPGVNFAMYTAGDEPHGAPDDIIDVEYRDVTDERQSLDDGQSHNDDAPPRP